MDPKLKIVMQLHVQEAGVIDGFCYPYCRLLLHQALVLWNSGELVERRQGYERPRVTDLGLSLLEQLANQTSASQLFYGSNTTIEQIGPIITHSQKFLAIFEE